MNKLKWLGLVALLATGGCMTNAKHLRLQKDVRDRQYLSDKAGCAVDVQTTAEEVQDMCNQWGQQLQLRDAYMLCSVKRDDVKQAPNITWQKGLKAFCDKIFALTEPKKAQPKKTHEIYLPPRTYDNSKTK